MHTGHALSFGAALCCIAQCRFSRKTHNYLGFIEAALLAAASWFFDMRASVFLFAMSALTYLLRAIGLYRKVNPLLLHLILIIGGIVLNNRGLLVIPPMLIVWWLIAERHVPYSCYGRHELLYYRGGAFAIISREILLALWVIYSALIGDTCTMILRGAFLIRNLYMYLRYEIFSREAIDQRRYLRRARKYKRHL